jgi:maltose alpha-D-glucosyltransferase/alpha-amylase
MSVAQSQLELSTITADHLWYKDAVIYQLHVKSFCDANGDGIGDFPGLLSKLDYIKELGANTLWLLPFYPSPRRDDGYDVADYRDIHPDYGTLADFRLFLREAHSRGLRVIIDFVANHTSDQHPWFKRAQTAKPGSRWRNFYVWSDTDRKYADTSIILRDAEKSNWTWDVIAGAYYWHRYYAHQPDLNYDEPLVVEAILGAIRFWLQLGVDGLRLGAVPYLVEREGTTNENLPETHRILKRFRAEVERHFSDRVLLAEVNKWPEEVKDYFGEGDECHMAFHFPLMPRMYLAIAREDRFPLTDIIRQTPKIPDSCQWALFLRSHDELTLETVSSSERDFLWEAYAADSRARINLGIKRRLAPLVKGDRRRIELLNSLMLSLPGAPVIYYGDEIAMGDNIHLGDRDSVRTPMQWSPDRNGGFSRADPPDLVLPINMDAIYGYETVNVESQLRDRYSLLNWMRRMLAVRKRHAAFGRGTLTLLFPKNRKILAYVREHDGDTLLCVANLAASPQAVELDLARFAPRVPVELQAGALFPPIGELTYLLTLLPYGFYWFALAATADPPAWHTPAPEPLPEFMTIVIRDRLASEVPEIANRLAQPDTLLLQYIAKRRWFNPDDQDVQAARITDVVDVGDADHESVLTIVEVTTPTETSRWLLPLGVLWEDDVATNVLANRLAMARIRRHQRVGLLTDAFALPTLVRRLMEDLADAKEIGSGESLIRFQPTDIGRSRLKGLSDREFQWVAAEHGNSCLTIGDDAAVKLYRRIAVGPHPEAEVYRYLTSHGFSNAPALFGEVFHFANDGAPPSTIAIAVEFIRNQGDAWVWILDNLSRLIEVQAPAATTISSMEDLLTDCDAICGAIGRRLGEMHAVLRRDTEDPAFAAEVAGAVHIAQWAKEIKGRVAKAFDSLGSFRAWTRDRDHERAQHLLIEREALMVAVDTLAKAGHGTLMTRIHGDFHLGQILVASGDAYIIDFEGEPGTSVAQRRAKTSPLRDVAGLLRSIDYASASLIDREAVEAAGMDTPKRDLLMLQFRTRASEAFLNSYWESAGTQLDAATGSLLILFLIEKVAYEIDYEATHRPPWIGVPIAGLQRLLERMKIIESTSI